ncbi:hypothetical protein H4S01_000360 [Coemansia sp. RSA 2610]|nr:hypothetical protein H4S01_000360 [Coemansia sp. RSA 2610]
MQCELAVLVAIIAGSYAGVVFPSTHDGATLAPSVLVDSLQHWGRQAASTYERFEDWDACAACQHPDIADTQVNATWSTMVPAFSRGYVGIQHARREVVVAVRGTTHVMDALADAQLVQVPWPADTRAHVHAGFLLAYRAARPHILGALRQIEDDPELAGYSVRFLGHSLGAAQASLAFADYVQHANTTERRRYQLVTMGAPRVGDSGFAAILDALATEHAAGGVQGFGVLRVVHANDIVVHLPRVLGRYVHGGREVWARGSDAAGWELRVCRRAGEDPGCSASVGPLWWSMGDHLEYPGMRLGIPKY